MARPHEAAAPGAPAGGIAVVIPCYRVERQILGVLAGIGPEVDRIYVVDDGCPQQSGKLVEETVRDPRVRVIHHGENRGVGAAVVLPQSEATPERLRAEILAILRDDNRRARMAASARTIARPDAAARLADALVSLAGLEAR